MLEIEQQLREHFLQVLGRNLSQILSLALDSSSVRCLQHKTSQQFGRQFQCIRVGCKGREKGMRESARMRVHVKGGGNTETGFEGQQQC
jgi:hypothetical protein